ncbi:hypothetical protein SYJ56_18685 [Algoriphagus sp. D3-2-R+10]|uniref:hypothetical protein n=1 Tax=Algoriphagus aurantiacus TaxID=3103948 RepID=UPI002B3BE30E|nr:hypothetical protein [Algoriphagus sp. D3-2-R+10]MEB2777348.1 hypothetical protein [Algoriphagus sp. D3-2-R+10]
MSNNDEVTRKLIMESIAKTSDDFSDQLMERIEKPRPARIPVWHLYAFIGSVIFICLILLISVKLRAMNLFEHFTGLNLPPMTIQILVVMFVIFAINKLRSLKQETEENGAQHESMNNGEFAEN